MEVTVDGTQDRQQQSTHLAKGEDSETSGTDGIREMERMDATTTCPFPSQRRRSPACAVDSRKRPLFDRDKMRSRQEAVMDLMKDRYPPKRSSDAATSSCFIIQQLVRDRTLLDGVAVVDVVPW